MISDGLMVMIVASQAEWMGLIEQCMWCVCVHICVYWVVLQMAAVSMAAIKLWEVSGQG